MMEKASLINSRLKNKEVKKESVTEKANLATQRKGNMVEGQRVAKKRQRKMAAQQESIIERKNLSTNQAGRTIDQTRIGLSRQKAAASQLEGTKEKRSAGFSIANAIAKVTGGSGWMGPAALAVGGIAATMLFGYLSSVGGGEGGGGGGGATGGSAGAALPALKEGGEGIEPVNSAAENKKMISTALTANKKDIERPGGPTNITVVTQVDAVTGKAIKKVTSEDPGSYAAGDTSKISAPTR